MVDLPPPRHISTLRSVIARDPPQRQVMPPDRTLPARGTNGEVGWTEAHAVSFMRAAVAGDASHALAFGISFFAARVPNHELPHSPPLNQLIDPQAQRIIDFLDAIGLPSDNIIAAQSERAIIGDNLSR
jgi:hypothetical protein